MNDEEESLIMMLPDDLVLNCLARVSRFDYPTLSLVSKRFRSLLASKEELYRTRTLLGCMESYLYVCLRLGNHSNSLSWFILCPRPNSSRRVLVPISSPSFPGSGVVVVGPNIYAIGGLQNNVPSSNVMVMDCCSHIWREAPSMRVARVFPSACIFDGKIYVAGGCKNLDSTNWMEIFDTKTQTWEFLQIPSEEICRGSLYKIIGYEGTLCVRCEEGHSTYKLHKGRWRAADLRMNMVWSWSSSSSYCVIENVFYCFSDRAIRWYDPKNRVFQNVKGLQGLPRYNHVKLADYGGNMAILWEEYVNDEHLQGKKIWCAEIAFDKHKNCEIWGRFEWLDNVFIPNGPSGSRASLHALATPVC